MFRDLLLYLDATASGRRTTAAAMDLAKRCGARVLGVFVVAPVRLPGYVAADIPQSALDSVRRASLDRAHEQERSFRDLATESGVEVEWRVFENDPAFAVNGCARAVDVVVLPQAEPDNAGSRALLDEVALGCGRPVLLVPRGGAPVGFGERVLVAWNGSRESSGAVHDALPMLRQAKRVVLAAADGGEKQGTELDAIVAHLGRHGVAAETRRLRAGAGAAGDALLGLAADEGVDLLVMGAWGHSRLREMVLGGVTAHVTRHSTVPVLMAH